MRRYGFCSRITLLVGQLGMVDREYSQSRGPGMSLEYCAGFVLERTKAVGIVGLVHSFTSLTML